MLPEKLSDSLIQICDRRRMKSKKRLQSLFNILLFSFLMIVPLVPIKIKVAAIPISADFIIGGLMILVGLLLILLSEHTKATIAKLYESRQLCFFTIVAFVVLLISGVSIVYAPDRIVAITETMRFAEYILLFLLILLIVDETTIERSYKVFYFTMIFASIFGIAQIFFNWSKFSAGGFLGNERIYATFVNPNYWGAALNLVIFVPVIRIVEGSKTMKFDVPVLILFLVNLVLCSTRVAWIGLFLGLVIIFIIEYRRRLPFVMVVPVLLALVPSVRGRFAEPFYATERMNVWKTGFTMFKDHWLTGVGSGGYVYRYKEYMRLHPELVQRKPQYSTHNSYIKMFSELGVAGGIAFVALYVGMFLMVLRLCSKDSKYRRTALAITGFGVAYLFQNLFNNLMFVPQLNVFVFIGCALLCKGELLELAKQ